MFGLGLTVQQHVQGNRYALLLFHEVIVVLKISEGVEVLVCEL